MDLLHHGTRAGFGSGILVLALAAGCGGDGLYPAGGKVAFKDGTPLQGGLVVFEPTNPAVKVGARGDIQPDGTFRLGTRKEGDGALEGHYRVTVAVPHRFEGGGFKPVIHPRYEHLDSSKLEFTVTRDKDKNQFAIVVEKAR
jgi:hypothetical protein